MATSPDYADYILDQLAELPNVRQRKMFGGIGLYVDDTFCAIVSSKNRFFLRVGPNNIDDYAQLGMEQFGSHSKGVGMPYYEVPEQILEDRASVGTLGSTGAGCGNRGEKVARLSVLCGYGVWKLSLFSRRNGAGDMWTAIWCLSHW